MSEDAEKLLMMMIRDLYKSQTGRFSKKTSIAAIKFVASDNKLQRIVNASDYSGILRHKIESGKSQQ